MFYCKSCGEERGWPLDTSTSRGPCEVCHKISACFDVPSGALPVPPRPRTTEPVKSQKTKTKAAKRVPGRRRVDKHPTRRKKKAKVSRLGTPTTITPRFPDHATLVEEARAACRCVSCVGGYPIGPYTLQADLRGRPSSCVAAIIVAEFLRRERMNR